MSFEIKKNGLSFPTLEIENRKSYNGSFSKTTIVDGEENLEKLGGCDYDSAISLHCRSTSGNTVHYNLKWGKVVLRTKSYTNRSPNDGREEDYITTIVDGKVVHN